MTGTFEYRLNGRGATVTLVVEAFHEVTNECVLSMVASVRALAVQAVHEVTGPALVFEERLQFLDAVGGSRLLEEVTPFVKY